MAGVGLTYGDENSCCAVHGGNEMFHTCAGGPGEPLGYCTAWDGTWANDQHTDSGCRFSRHDAVFVGGSTLWKMGDPARELVAEANGRGLWTHMGRVNSKRRLRYAASIGCDSVDGTNWARFTDTYLHQLVMLDHTQMAL